MIQIAKVAGYATLIGLILIITVKHYEKPINKFGTEFIYGVCLDE